MGFEPILPTQRLLAKSHEEMPGKKSGHKCLLAGVSLTGCFLLVIPPNNPVCVQRLPLLTTESNKETGVVGFEPTHMGTKIPCLTAWRNPIEACLRKANYCYRKWNMMNSNHRHAAYKAVALPTELIFQKRETVDLHHATQPALLYPILCQTMAGCHPVHGAGFGASLRAKVLHLTGRLRTRLCFFTPYPPIARTGVGPVIPP